MTDKIKLLSRDIVTSIAESLLSGQPADEILEMFVNTSTFLDVLLGWTHAVYNVNLLQWAILCQSNAVAVHLCEISPCMMSSVYYKVNMASLTESEVFPPALELPHFEGFDLSQIKLNPPLHLACLVGDVTMMRYFIERHAFSICEPALVKVKLPCSHEGPDGHHEFDTNLSGMPFSRSVDKTDAIHSRGCCVSASSVDKSSAEFSTTLQKPLEICMEKGHLACVEYLVNSVIFPNVMLVPSPLGNMDETSLLHKACYLGVSGLVERLIKHPDHEAMLNATDRYGHVPLHLAAWNGNQECIRVLLQAGADVNMMWGSKSALHVLYKSKLQPFNFHQNTVELIKYGINVNAKDAASNTPLHYLVAELGLSFERQSMFWFHLFRYIQTFTTSQPVEYSLVGSDFRHNVLQCMHHMLSNGAELAMPNMPSHTVLDTLLQYCSRPMSKTLCKEPQLIYDALKLLLDNGADPNIIGCPENGNAFTQFLMYQEEDIFDVSMKEKFLMLFLNHGVNPDQRVQEPKNYSFLRYHWPDEGLFPVLIALKEKHPVSMVRVLCDFTSLQKLYEARMITESRCTLSGQRGLPNEMLYRSVLVAATQRLRSLRHHCKLAVLTELNRQGDQVCKLPFPRLLKDYLLSANC